MNIFFAAVGIIFGLAGAGTALVWTGRESLEDKQIRESQELNEGSEVKGGGSVEAQPVWLNEYQLYLFLAEFLMHCDMTNGPTDTLTHHEFYRIVFKLIRVVQGV